MSTYEEIIDILVDILQLQDRKDELSKDTLLLGSMPEFDSMAVVSIMTSIEEHFGIVIDDDEVSAETFESIGSLVNFVEQKI